MIENIRNGFYGFLYRNILRKFFFCLDPEKVHDSMILFGTFLGSNMLTRGMIRGMYYYGNDKLRQKILGIDFQNPVGLAAGGTGRGWGPH